MKGIEDLTDYINYIIREFVKQTSIEKFKELKEIVENER